MVKTVAIVGHGPSMSKSGYGEEIDSHDIVIRLKRSIHLLLQNKDFGTKYDVAAGSLHILPLMKDMLITSNVNIPLMCLFDSRHEKLEDWQVQVILTDCFPYSVISKRDVCNDLDVIYRSKLDANDKTSERHTSQGLKALWLAGHLYPNSTIDLYGFDNVKTGTFTWSLTRGEDWDKYPNHRWDIEHNMIPFIQTQMGGKINVK